MSLGSRAGSSVWWEAARPRTLPAAVAPVLVASALAWRDGGFQISAALICLAFSLLIQIGTNFANDYYDFVKGADTVERVGPRRAVAAGLIAPPVMRRAMIGVFVVAFLVGLALLPFGGWPLLIVGVTSIVCGVLYTGGPYPLAYHGWGDVFVFVFFGLVAVTTTYFVQCGSISEEAWVVGVGIGALATNILVVNNYRDIETDRKAGKRTLVVRWGRGFAQIQFILAHLLMILSVVLLWKRGYLGDVGTAALLVFLLIVAFLQLMKLRRSETALELIVLLGSTGRHVALTAVFVAVALVWSGQMR